MRLVSGGIGVGGAVADFHHQMISGQGIHIVGQSLSVDIDVDLGRTIKGGSAQTMTGDTGQKGTAGQSGGFSLSSPNEDSNGIVLSSSTGNVDGDGDGIGGGEVDVGV